MSISKEAQCKTDPCAKTNLENGGTEHWNGLINAKKLSYSMNIWISDTDYQ